MKRRLKENSYASKGFEPVSREHNGFVEILHVGRNKNGFFYYVMELADDDSNGNEIDPAKYAPKTFGSALARSGRLSVKYSNQLGWELSEALAELHRRGLVHRDIKPSNIIFVKRTRRMNGGGKPSLRAYKL